MQLAWSPDSVTVDIPVIADLTLLWGLDAVTLRYAGSSSERVPFVNEARIRTSLLEADLAIAAIDPGNFEGDVSDRTSWLNEVYASTEAFEFCSRTQCDIVQVSAFNRKGAPTTDDLMSPFKALLDRVGHGNVVAVKNEAWSCLTTASSLATLIDRLGRPAARASWCAATSLRMGEDVARAADAIAPMLSIVRCTDVTLDSGRRVLFGDGDVPWDAVFERLLSAGFDGVVSLELPRQSSRNDGLRASTALITSLRRAHAAIERSAR